MEMEMFEKGNNMRKDQLERSELKKRGRILEIMFVKRKK